MEPAGGQQCGVFYQVVISPRQRESLLTYPQQLDQFQGLFEKANFLYGRGKQA